MNRLELLKLEPAINRGCLEFWCPRCRPFKSHRIQIPFVGIAKHWDLTGLDNHPVTGAPTFDSVSLNPQIDLTGAGRCLFKGWVSNGWVSW